MKFKPVIRSLLLTLATTAAMMVESHAAQRELNISSIEELIECAAMDSVNVTMKSGVYNVDDTKLFQRVMLKKYGSATSIPTELKESDFEVYSLLCFSGDNSTYNLEGVVVKLSSTIHTSITRGAIYKLLVVGDNNLIRGLSMEDESEDVEPITSAIMATVVGDDNTLDGVNILVKGSTYGYGHLLGKGVGNVVPIHKQSSLLVAGVNTKLLNCRVVTHAYGHGIVMQGAVNTLIEGCYVEGQMRPSDEMLQEREGLAFDSGFKSIYPPGVIEPNRMIALSEDGIRTYQFGPLVGRRTERVTVVNSTVKNMRSGVDLGVHVPPTVITGCTMIECQEKGYAVGSQAVITNSRGDAKYGPLLTFQGNSTRDCYVELELIPSESDYKVTRLAEVNGYNHYIKLTAQNSKIRETPLPIVFGESFWSDVHIFRQPDADPSNFSGAYNITLVNECGMPAVFKPLSRGCRLFTDGEVEEDMGENNVVCELSNDVLIYNRGVAGNTSSDLLNRVYADVAPLSPDLTIVMVGTNDMLNSRKVVSYGDYEKNLTQLIEQIKGFGSDVMLVSSLPADSEYLFERHDKSKYAAHPDEVMSVARGIVEELALRLDCYFVDLHGEFTSRGLPKHNKDQYIRNQKNCGVKDGVHPTADGYSLMGEIIWGFIEEQDLQNKYKKIVCFGDSITKGSGANGAGTIQGENYPSYLNRKFNH